MKIVFTQEAWEEYSYWAKNDKKILRTINRSIKEIAADKVRINKPKQLQFTLKEYFSKRITKLHRLIYKKEEEGILILSCRYL